MRNPFKRMKTESKAGVEDQLDDLLSKVGYNGVSFKMAQDIFNSKTLTIHQEKAKCKKAYNTNSFVQVSVNYLLNVLEGEDPCIESENKVIKEYGRKWGKFSNWKIARKEALQEAIITGDGYIRKIKGDKGSFKYQHIENSEDIYIDWDWENERPKKYIQRLYFSSAQAKRMGIKAHTLKTIYGVETIYGIEYSPEEIIHLKFMNNYWRVYGRTPLASILNDIEVMDRIERSIAIISMFKAIPQKILTPKQASQDKPSIWTPNQVKMIGNQLKNQKDFENPLIGTPMDSLNLTDSGQLIELTGYLDYFKRKISMVLSPEFIVHGELVNRNTGTEQKQLFYLSVVSIRDWFIDSINESLKEGMNASLNILKEQGIKIPDATFYFEWGEFDIELREEKTKRLIQEWNLGLITLNEYREELGYKEDEEIGNLRRFDLMGSPSEQAMESIKGAINGDSRETKEDTKE